MMQNPDTRDTQISIYVDTYLGRYVLRVKIKKNLINLLSLKFKKKLPN